MRLEELGPRICIMGPSNSGKSTLAASIARRRGLRPTHLDQLHHLPGTDWTPRPEADFAALHEKAISGGHWVMDGNYTRLISRRLRRATGLILLDAPTVLSLVRHIRRCSLQRERAGALDGGLDSIKWPVIRQIVLAAEANRERYKLIFEEACQAKVRLGSPKELRRFYMLNRLSR